MKKAATHTRIRTRVRMVTGAGNLRFRFSPVACVEVSPPLVGAFRSVVAREASLIALSLPPVHGVTPTGADHIKYSIAEPAVVFVFARSKHLFNRSSAR